MASFETSSKKVKFITLGDTLNPFSCEDPVPFFFQLRRSGSAISLNFAASPLPSNGNDFAVSPNKN